MPRISRWHFLRRGATRRRHWLPDEVETKAGLSGVGAQTMLTEGIAEAYRKGRDELAQRAEPRLVLQCGGRENSPDLLTTTGADFLASSDLGEKCSDRLN